MTARGKNTLRSPGTKRSAGTRGRRRGRPGTVSAGQRLVRRRSGSAFTAGAAAGRLARQTWGSVRERRVAASRLWARWWTSRPRRNPWRNYRILAAGFLRGYRRGLGWKAGDFVPLPTIKSVSAIVNTVGAGGPVTAVLDQLERLPLDEILVVMSGEVEHTWQNVAAHPAMPTLVYIPEPLGYDAGRAVGAKLAASDIILFLDGESPVRAERLLPFIDSISRGSDLALNNTAQFMGSFNSWPREAMVKEFLNCVQDRRDLGAASLAGYPHALSRRAIEVLTPARLAVPPVAQAEAIAQGLKVTVPAAVKVGQASIAGMPSALLAGRERSMLLGDYLEAVHEQTARSGERFGHPDSLRKRDKVKEAETCG